MGKHLKTEDKMSVPKRDVKIKISAPRARIWFYWSLGIKFLSVKQWWGWRGGLKPDHRLSVRSPVHLSSYSNSLGFDMTASCLSLIL